MTFAATAAQSRPNFIMVFIDDLGWGDFSCFGNKDAKTPNIDRLAAEGIRFSQFYVNSPICSPSRCALTTGQYPQRWRITSFLNHRADNERRGMAQWLDPQAPTLARLLQQAGYATGHFGKWHLGGQRDVDDAPPISDYGFDEALTNFEGMGAKLLPLTLKPGDTQPGRIWADAERLGGPVVWMQRSEITGGFINAAIAFINRDVGRAQEITEKFGIAKCYADWREMFDAEKPDFVDIITPPPSHAEMCAEAARRGIHIIRQKPLAPTLGEARAIVATAARAGVRLMVHENFRFQPWHREIKRQLDAGAIGQLFSLNFRSRMGDGWGENAYIPRQPYFRGYPRLLVYETGLHFIDTFRYLAGDITRATAWLRRLNPVIKGEDCGLLVFEFASGAIGQWDANRYNEPACPLPEARYTFGEFLVEGSEGSLRLHLDGRLTLKKLGGDEQTIEYPHERRGFAGDCVFATQRHFIDRLLDGKPFETSGEDYLITTAVQEACYQSAARHAPVEIF